MGAQPSEGRDTLLLTPSSLGDGSVLILRLKAQGVGGEAPRETE